MVVGTPNGITIKFLGEKYEGSYNLTVILYDHLGNRAIITVILAINMLPTLNIESPIQTTYKTESTTILLSGGTVHY